MKIMGAEVEEPVQWTVTTAAGLAWPLYLLADSPVGTPDTGIQTLLYWLTGIAAVRAVALVVLFFAHKLEVER